MVGIILLVSMTIFSVLLYTNLRKMRGRIQPIVNGNPSTNHILRKRDRDMIRMLLIEDIHFLYYDNDPNSSSIHLYISY